MKLQVAFRAADGWGAVPTARVIAERADWKLNAADTPMLSANLAPLGIQSIELKHARVAGTVGREARSPR